MPTKKKSEEVDDAQIQAVWDMLFSEEVNGDQIESYIALDFDKQLESSRRRLENNSKLSIDEALDEEAGLPEKVSNVMIQSRVRLAEGMCYGTAKALYERLGCGNLDPRRESDALLEINDPVKGPIVKRLLLLERGREKGYGLLQKKVDGLRAEVDKKASEVVRPLLPCSLIDALRFAANDPEMEVESLKRLFRDFCRSAPEVWPGETEFLVEMGALAPLGDKNQNECGISPNFWKPFFNEPNYIRENVTLTWLGAGILPFKKKWSRNEACVEGDLGPDTNNLSVAGKGGADKRELKVWKKRTAEFIEYSREITMKGVTLIEILDGFMATRKEGDKSKDKIGYFLGTLLNHPWNCREGELMNRFQNPNMGIRRERDKDAGNHSDYVAKTTKPGSPKQPVETEEMAIAELRFTKNLVDSMKKVPREAILQCHKMLWDAKLIKSGR